MKRLILLSILSFTVFAISAQDVVYDFEPKVEVKKKEILVESPYAMFGDNTAVLQSKQEDDKDHSLKIPIVENEQQEGLFKLDFKTGIVSIEDTNGNIVLSRRLNQKELARFTSIDPLAEKFYSWSPYTYCFNNPLKFIDPSGMAPIYDQEGNLIGTDENGLLGDAIFMDAKNFTQGMSNKDAMKHNTGMSGFSDEARERYQTSFNGLSSRPDYDGVLTVSEAEDWYRNGNGQSLYIDASKIDLKGVDITMLQKGQEQGYNFFLLNGANSTTGRVYGTLALTLLDDKGTVHIGPSTKPGMLDEYNFEMHEGQPVRNAFTSLGKAYAGGRKGGTDYKMMGYGKGQVQTRPHSINPWTGRRY